jgi:hypothetical protein
MRSRLFLHETNGMKQNAEWRIRSLCDTGIEVHRHSLRVRQGERGGVRSILNLNSGCVLTQRQSAFGAAGKTPETIDPQS